MISFGLIGYGKLGKCLAKRWDDEGLSFKVFSNFNRAKKPKSLRIAENLEELVKESKVIFLAVPPNQIKQVIKECSEISEEKQFVSLAASVSLESLKELNSPYIARFMTSTFCEKGLAMGFLAGKYKGEWEPDLIVFRFCSKRER